MQLFISILGLLLLGIPSLVLTHNSCYTPTGGNGFCVPSQQCKFVKDLQSTYGRNVPRTIVNQLRQMACIGSQRSIFYLCCPSNAVIKAQSDGNAKRETQNKSTVDTRQSSADLKRIDPSGMKLLNSVTECGKKTNTKLSGGDETRIGEFPWLVLLKYETSGRPFLCGGSLITDRFVLTAAHCVNQARKLIGVRMGDHDLNKEEDCQVLGGRRRVCLPPYEEYGIESIRSHPNYESNNNDIALIKVDRPVNFKWHIKPICLPIDKNSQDITYDQSFYISGWGRTEQITASSVLLKALVTRADLDVCRNFYVNGTVSENHICAVGESDKQTCAGDSGGPLFFRNPFKETVRYVQYGIVSHGGSLCGARENQPGVFASVLEQLPWITQNLY
ncbi:GH19618 [Drosophila grimshawi]|uniref:CLIP domain-containing serine protease n=1 Tax=Drosophila grimshawi TaxID=7222 RepID=B4JRS0_DROGR|nr:GH19618 [Drosophila grimshawi]